MIKKSILKKVVGLIFALALFISCDNIGGKTQEDAPDTSKTIEDVLKENGLSVNGEKTGTEKEIAETEKKLNALGLIKNTDYTISGSGNETVIKLTDAGTKKIENKLKGENGETENENGDKTGEIIQIDLSDINLGIQFCEGAGDFFCILRLSDYNKNPASFKIGDTAKILFKAKSNVPLKSIYIGLCYDEFHREDGSGKIYFAPGNVEQIAEDVAANTEFSGTIESVNEKKDINDTENLYLTISCHFDGNYDFALLENGSGIPSGSDRIKLSAESDGIHISLKDLTLLGEKWSEDNPGTITVLGSPIELFAETEGESDYVYPFVNENENVYVKISGGIKKSDGSEYWHEELLKIKAVSTQSINDFIETDAIKKYKNIKLKTEFNADTLKFKTIFENAGSLSDYLNSEKISNISANYNLGFGKSDWSESCWAGGATFKYENSTLKSVISHGWDEQNLTLYNDDIFKDGIIAINGDACLTKIVNYDNQYWSDFVLKFKINSTHHGWFALPKLVSDVEKFAQENLTVIFDPSNAAYWNGTTEEFGGEKYAVVKVKGWDGAWIDFSEKKKDVSTYSCFVGKVFVKEDKSLPPDSELILGIGLKDSKSKTVNDIIFSELYSPKEASVKGFMKYTREDEDIEWDEDIKNSGRAPVGEDKSKVKDISALQPFLKSKNSLNAVENEVVFYIGKILAIK